MKLCKNKSVKTQRRDNRVILAHLLRVKKTALEVIHTSLGVQRLGQRDSADILIPKIWPSSSKQLTQRRAVLLPSLSVPR
jgi:hypothetical protein